MKNRPLNVAVIGCGFLARAQHIPNVLACPGARLHTCCDLNRQILTDLSAQYPGVKTASDFRDAVTDPEVEFLIVANPLRRPTSFVPPPPGTESRSARTVKNLVMPTLSTCGHSLKAPH